MRLPQGEIRATRLITWRDMPRSKHIAASLRATQSVRRAPKETLTTNDEFPTPGQQWYRDNLARPMRPETIPDCPRVETIAS